LKIKKEIESLIEYQGKLEKNYSLCQNEDEFKNSIKDHYHGDFGNLFLTPSVGCRTIWQCGCGYRSAVGRFLNDLKITELVSKK
jgi:hypothetical protein